MMIGPNYEVSVLDRARDGDEEAFAELVGPLETVFSGAQSRPSGTSTRRMTSLRKLL